MDELGGVEAPLLDEVEFPLIFFIKVIPTITPPTIIAMRRAKMIKVAKDMDFTPIKVFMTLAYLD